MDIPSLTPDELTTYLAEANASARHRSIKILHQPGAEFNQVINIILPSSYMQPHQHPDPNRAEEIWLLDGKIAVIFFDDAGKANRVVRLDQKNNYIKIPGLAWHTYITLSDYSVSYETMHGVYDPATWKKMADWAPIENSPESVSYLADLKQFVATSQ